MDPDPDPVCPERLDPDLDPDPVNIRPDPQPCSIVCKIWYWFLFMDPARWRYFLGSMLSLTTSTLKEHVYIGKINDKHIQNEPRDNGLEY